jgi:hypothetical protein
MRRAIFVIYFSVAASVVLYICIGLVAPFVDLWFNGITCQQTYLTSTERIENSAHLQLPNSARDVQGYFGGKGKCRTYVRFTMDPADYTALIATTRIKLPLSPEAYPSTFIVAPAKLDWKLDSFQSHLAGRSIVSLDYNQRILIDTSNASRYSVYLVTEHED